MLPQLREVERRFGPELVVIGIHSGKFLAERRTANIRRATWRYGIRHPVVNDRRFRVWRAYAVSAWPTLTVIDADGRVVAQQAGETPADVLAAEIGQHIEAAAARGILDRTPLPFTPDAEPTPAGPLRFPAKLTLDADGARLHVADTGHDRVLEAALEEGARRARIMRVVGASTPGFRDGPAEGAAFDHPRGLAVTADGVYVADTGNHAIRLIDRATGTVRTAAGTGVQARSRPAGGAAERTALSSPWDLASAGSALVIAMAGTHQLWRLDTARGRIEPWVGSGAEALGDGPPEHAALAQPSGLAVVDGRVYVADAESSAIRVVSLADGAVETLVGTGLFDFGERDGAGDEVRLQHPLGIAVARGRVFIADTYNDRIRVLNPATREVTTWLPDAELAEPGGLAIVADRLFIADTDHHRIVVASLTTGSWHTLELVGA